MRSSTRQWAAYLLSAAAPCAGLADTATCEDDRSGVCTEATPTIGRQLSQRSTAIDELADELFFAPNVTFIETQSEGYKFAIVRGVSQARGTDSSLSVIVDGVPLTHPAQLGQQLLDAGQIDLTRSSYDLLQGRGALAGTVIVRTEEAPQAFQSELLAKTVHSGGWRTKLSVGGPIGDAGKLGYQGSVLHADTHGTIDNTYLNDSADPAKDQAARFRLRWAPTDRLSAEVGLHDSRFVGQANYFVFAPQPDEILPVRVNNPGYNELEHSLLSFKVDLSTRIGTFSSISAVADTEEIATGDAFNFLPPEESFFYQITGLFDLAQSQYLDVHSISQEFRFSSLETRPIRWTVGVYYLDLDQFLSATELLDVGLGITPVYREPPTGGSSPVFSFRADELRDTEWSVYGGIESSLGERVTLSVSARRSNDEREQTTLTPQRFLRPVPSGPQPTTGEVRESVSSSWRPAVALTYDLSEGLDAIVRYSTGFRPGGFNQVGVGAIAQAANVLGVADSFDAEESETLELGLQGGQQAARFRWAATIFETRAENVQYFYALLANASENVANLERVRYRGVELELGATVAAGLDVSASYGYTANEITEAANPAHVGNRVPLSSISTGNLSVQYQRQVGPPFDKGGIGLQLVVRVDYRRIGDTYWAPDTSVARSPIALVNAKIGIGGPSWALMLWRRNASDVGYYTEFAPFLNGGVAFPAPGREWGIELSRSFAGE